MSELRSLLPKLLLAAFSTGFALCAAELALTLSQGPAAQGPRAAIFRAAAARRGVPFDERSRLEVVLADRAEHGRGLPHFLPIHARNKFATFRERLLPIASLSRSTMVYCNDDGPWLRVASDEFGFRNPPGAWSAPEVVTIGDSYTEGLCLPNGETMVDRVRTRGFAVLNLGVSGAGPLSQLGAIREYLPRTSPRFVLWIYYEGNDLIELESEREHAILKRYLGDFTQGLVARQPEIDAAIEAYLAGAERTELARAAPPPLTRRLRGIVTLRSLRALAASARVPREIASPPPCCDLPLFAEVLERARERANAQRAQLVFVYLPSGMTVAEPTKAHVKQITMYRDVLAIAEAADLPIVDVRALFAADPSPTRFFPFPDGHFNATGADAAGLAVAEALRELGRASP